MTEFINKLSYWIQSVFIYIWLFLVLLIAALIGIAFKLLPLSGAIQALFLAVQSMLMFVLVLVTWWYARETARISKATEKQAEATKELVETAKKEAEDVRGRASKEYVKELITTVFYPLLGRCTEVKRQLDANNFSGCYFAGRYVTGWQELSGLPSDFDDEEAKVLAVDTSEGRQVFSFPEPSLGILSHRSYSSVEMGVWFRMPSFEDEHKDIIDHIKDFDSKQPKLNKLLRSLVVEIKKIVVPYVNSSMEEGLFLFYSEKEKRKFISYVAEICFNYLLMVKEFNVFLRDFDRNQAKVFWEEHKEDLINLLDKEHIQGQAAKIRHLSGELSEELSQICDSLETLETEYRDKHYITLSELPPFLLWQLYSKGVQYPTNSDFPARDL